MVKNHLKMGGTPFLQVFNVCVYIFFLVGPRLDKWVFKLKLWHSSVGAGRRVGTAGPTRGGGVPTLSFGEQFFDFFPKKWLFLGMFV